MLISALALAMVFSTTTESSLNSNFRDSKVAEYAANAGIQQARERLVPSAGDYLGNANVPAAMPSLAGGITYITNPAGAGDVIQPTDPGNAYFDDELCHENFAGLLLGNPGNNVPCVNGPPAAAVTIVTSNAPDTNTAAALGYKWVRITQKANNSTDWLVFPGGDNTVPVCWDGNPAVMRERLLPPDGRLNCDSDPPAGAAVGPMHTVYMLTSLAVTPRGTRHMTQAEVALDPPITLNAAVESNNNVTLNGSLTVTGYDNCSCSCVSWGTGAGTTVTCTTRLGHATCDSNRYGIFASGTVENPTGANEQVYAGTTPSYVGSNTTPPSGPFPYNVQQLVAQYSQMSGVVNATGAPYNWVCTSGNCGTQTSTTFGTGTFPLNPPDNPNGMVPQVTYIPGSVKLTSNATGSGILIVNGDLEINGGLQFYGLVLVSGSVHFTGGGTNPVNIYGGVLSGTPITDDTVIGGSANIQYDYCALQKGMIGQVPRMLALRDLSY
jgi:hypothetical protein